MAGWALFVFPCNQKKISLGGRGGWGALGRLSVAREAAVLASSSQPPSEEDKIPTLHYRRKQSKLGGRGPRAESRRWGGKGS